MKAQRLLLLTVLVFSGCGSESERFSQVFSSDSGMSCGERKEELESLWRDVFAPIVRETLTESATWSKRETDSAEGEVATKASQFELVMSDLVLKPTVLVGNQSASMGQACERPKAHFSLRGVEAEATTLMSACIDLPLLGETCDKSTARLLARVKNAMISVDLIQDQQKISFEKSRVMLNLSELRLADPV